MSIRIMSQVWDNGPDDRNELLVLLALADFANDEGECWPSMIGVAEKSRMTERGAQKVIRRLEECGWIKTDTGGGRGGKNKYRILAANPERETTNAKRGIQEKPRTDEHKPRTDEQKTPNGRSPEPSGTVKEPSEVKETPASVLEIHAGSEAVSSFIAYRRKSKGNALTVTGAKRIASSLAAINSMGGDASDALGMAEERGWLSINPDWYFNAKGKWHGKPSNSATDDPTLRAIARAAGTF